jgi:hypothetical protein
MRRLFMPVGLALVVVAGLGIAALVSAAGQRPMNGQIALFGGPTGDSSCGAEAVTIELAGDGTLAHLGKTSITASNCAGAELETGDAPIFEGSATFVAADGSTIQVSYEGSQEAPVGFVAEFTTTHTILGGSGRFEGAAGEWLIDGTVDLSTGVLLGDVSGWLSY